MTLLNNLFKTPSIVIPKWLSICFFILAFIGFADATFLTVEHYLGLVPPCSVLHGCEVVTTSQYSKIFGLPLALFGALYYLSLIILCIIYFESKKLLFLKIGSLITLIGFIASLYFVYLQIYIIKAVCLYCMLSALASFGLLIFGLILFIKLSIRNKDS